VNDDAFSFYDVENWILLRIMRGTKSLNPFFRLHEQGRNEVRWRPGQESSFAPPCSNLRSFGSNFTGLKKVLATLLGLFGAPSVGPPTVIRCPRSDSAPP